MHSATKNKQHGSALLVLLAIILAGMAFLIIKALNSSTVAGRNEATAANMSKAKEALVGFAASYRDTPSHSTPINGYLPLPDLGTSRNNSIVTGEGRAAANFAGNSTGMSVVGRLPWQSLGLSPPRDGNGECLWYAVSGSFQDNQKTVKFMNWDTLGQFDTYTSNGTAAGTVSTINANYHQRPAAIIFAPGSVTTGQTRTLSATDTVTECGGNYDARNYLDTSNANPLLNNIVNYLAGPTNNSTDSTHTFLLPKKIVMGSVSDASGNLLVNDMVLAITADDIFRVIKQSSGFGNYVTNNLLGAAASNLSLTLTPAAPATLHFPPATPTETPTETAGGMVIGSLEIGRVPSAALTTDDLKAWQDNLLYARCTSGSVCLRVNSPTPNCTGVVIFAGDRLPSQTRGSDAQKSNAWNNYLEGAVLTAFTTGTTTFNGNSAYSTTLPSTSSSDVLACVTSPNPGTTQKSFAADFGSFIPAAASTNITTYPTTQTVAIGMAPGGGNGCFWLPGTITLAGKTVRSYYEYQFANADNYATNGGLGTDRGNGMTLDIVDGTQGSPTSICGLASNMGAFIVSFPNSIGGAWAGESLTIETDVHRDINPLNTLANPDDTDPVENHTAIMAYGNLAHGTTAGSNGYLTTACNGTAAGCRFSTANQFEESSIAASYTLTGTANPTASTTLVGTSTLFTTELVIGDRITINAETRTVTAIASNTSLTVDAAFTDTASASITRLPAPQLHNQRVEIHSGCNSTCAVCNPASHIAPNTYVKISAWVDCADCNDVVTDSVQTPTVNRCILLDPALNSPYIALTGGFRAGAAAQGVTLSNFILRSE